MKGLREVTRRPRRQQGESRRLPQRPAIAVPWSRFLLLEGAFMAAVTVIIGSVGVLLEHVGYGLDPNAPCQSQGCRQAVKQLDAIRDDNM